MADDGSTEDGGPEVTALQDALAAEHAAVWGYGTVGAALPAADRAQVTAAEEAHRDVRDRLTRLLSGRGADPVPAEGGYALPFPVLSAVDAARLAVTLEEGTSRAWAWVLDRATERSTREEAVTALGDAEVRAVGWRARAGVSPVTTALPGLPS
ncbi:ferritin-like domain-containing protein [Modestobacter sp. NPDC049651]|uniref:ferritin-like domain-containing protein n=1 Tax=unclassified Modestobacter TaxID=2643866 RepID=UPI0033C850E2